MNKKIILISLMTLGLAFSTSGSVWAEDTVVEKVEGVAEEAAEKVEGVVKEVVDKVEPKAKHKVVKHKAKKHKANKHKHIHKHHRPVCKDKNHKHDHKHDHKHYKHPVKKTSISTEDQQGGVIAGTPKNAPGVHDSEEAQMADHGD